MCDNSEVLIENHVQFVTNNNNPGTPVKSSETYDEFKELTTNTYPGTKVMSREMHDQIRLYFKDCYERFVASGNELSPTDRYRISDLWEQYLADTGRTPSSSTESQGCKHVSRWGLNTNSPCAQCNPREDLLERLNQYELASRHLDPEYCFLCHILLIIVKHILGVDLTGRLERQ